MLGLRTEDSGKFYAFFALVQAAAEAKGCVFFVDAGDGNCFENEVMEGEDLMGWLIPKDRAAEFEPAWKAYDVSDEWSDHFCWATWTNANDPIITFTE